MDEKWKLVSEEGIISTYINEETGEVKVLQGDILLDGSGTTKKHRLVIEWEEGIPITKQIAMLKDVLEIDTKKVLSESRNSKVYTLGHFLKGTADDLIRKGASKGLKLYIG